jgi:hypothetical protein
MFSILKNSGFYLECTINVIGFFFLDECSRLCVPVSPGCVHNSATLYSWTLCLWTTRDIGKSGKGIILEEVHAFCCRLFWFHHYFLVNLHKQTVPDTQRDERLR